MTDVIVSLKQTDEPLINWDAIESSMDSWTDEEPLAAFTRDNPFEFLYHQFCYGLDDRSPIDLWMYHYSTFEHCHFWSSPSTDDYADPPDLVKNKNCPVPKYPLHSDGLAADWNDLTLPIADPLTFLSLREPDDPPLVFTVFECATGEIHRNYIPDDPDDFSDTMIVALLDENDFPDYVQYFDEFRRRMCYLR